MRRIEIDKDLLTNLYLIENLPKKKIAKILNVSLKVVCNRIKEYNLVKSQSDTLKSGWNSLTDEEYKARCESISKGNIEYYKNNPDQSKRNKNIQKSHLEYSEEKKNEIKNKCKNTMLETYGIEHIWQLEKNKDIILLSRGLNWPEYIDKYGIEDFNDQLSRLNITENPQLDIQRKTTETKHINNSFAGSTGEEILYGWLCNKYGAENVKRQYNKDDRYPYNCDFYITTDDLFIELQGNWTHGPHPFTGLAEDLKLIDIWASKSNEINFKGIKKGYYLDAIEVWTKCDVSKRQTAKKNNLKYIEIYKLCDDLESTLSEAYKL